MIDPLDITQRPYYPAVQDHLDVCLDDELKARDITSGTFLDVGTFDGSQAYFLSQKGFTVTATDADRRVLYSAMKTYPTVTFVYDDMCNSKITGTFDYVLDRGCYPQVEDKDRENYIKNLHRLCNKLLFLKILVDKRLDQYLDLQHVQKYFSDYFTVMSTADTVWSPTGPGISQFLVLEPR
jgi:hypothetical protein